MNRVLCGLLLLGSLARAETLPNAPSAVPRPIVETPNAVPGAVPAYYEPKSHDRWTMFVIVAGVDLAASVYDSHITEVGLHNGHGCVEANGGDPMPSPAKLYGKNLSITSGLIFAGYAMKKWLHLPIAPYAMMSIDGFKHGRGAYRWHHSFGGNCL